VTRVWDSNELHTLALEKELYALFQHDFSPLYVDSGQVAADGTPILDFNNTGGADGFGGIQAITVQQGVFAGKQMTWDVLANYSVDTGQFTNDALLTGQNETLSGRLNPAGYPYDHLGYARNMYGKIVDDQGYERTDIPNPPLGKLEIVWERKCDAAYLISLGANASTTVDACLYDPSNPSVDKRSVLQRFNQARTEDEKIDILNWFLVDAGLAPIPDWNQVTVEAQGNRSMYLQGLDTASKYPGVILPVAPFAGP
jgi:hypothetical protein